MKVYRAVQLRFAHFYAGILHFDKMDIENYTRIYIICVLSIYTHIYIHQQCSPESERNPLQAKDGGPQKTPLFFLSLVSGNLERDF